MNQLSYQEVVFFLWFLLTRPQHPKQHLVRSVSSILLYTLFSLRDHPSSIDSSYTNVSQDFLLFTAPAAFFFSCTGASDLCHVRINLLITLDMQDIFIRKICSDFEILNVKWSVKACVCEGHTGWEMHKVSINNKQAVKKANVATSAMSQQRECVCVYLRVYFQLSSIDLLRLTESQLSVDN